MMRIILKHWCDIAVSFRKARQGATAVMFAIAMPALVGVGGVATDYSAVTSSQNRLQGVIDSAALAIAREMTVTIDVPQRAQQLAQQYVAANIPANTPYAISVTATMVENNLAVKISGQQQISTPFGLLERFAGVTSISATALARVTGAASVAKVCMLSLGEAVNGGLFLHNGATITAPDCSMYSNSTDQNAVVIQQGSKVKSALVCARGGVKNLAGILETTIVTDCPVLKDPLAAKVEPATNGPCTNTLTIILSGTKTLSPGTYCNGVFIFGSAKVTMNPGIYVFRDGPFLVAQNAEVTGVGVSLVLTGKFAMLRLQDNSLINLSAPVSGAAAGMLVWETKGWIPGTNSWKSGGCGTVPSGIPVVTSVTKPLADLGPKGCSSVQSYISQLMKKTNEHHINSDRAKVLTGTIYLPKGLLLIDSRQPVADQSPFTVFVVNKLDLYDGPNLVLNANYNSSAVPVPPGLSPAIGGGQVRLGQ
jgi:Flp pilus assembly protein TadG